MVVAGIMVMASMFSTLQMALVLSVVPGSGLDSLSQVLTWIPVVTAVAINLVKKFSEKPAALTEQKS